MTGVSDIGQLASLARTALDDPESLPRRQYMLAQQVYGAEAAEDEFIEYAIAQLDAIMAITDPPELEGRHPLTGLARHLYQALERALLDAGFDPEEKGTDGEGDDEFWSALDRAFDHIDHVLDHLPHR